MSFAAGADVLDHARADDAPARAMARKERRFAAALLAPAFLALTATTTFPLLFLVWTSAWRMDLAMPFMDGFGGSRIIGCCSMTAGSGRRSS